MKCLENFGRNRDQRGLSSFFLHILAMALMLSDHLWATLFPQQQWMTCIGRIAFPIFAFMIVEGYFYTRNVKKYLGRMLLFAIVSEVPFNLIYGSSILYPYHQNVLWTFLMGLSGIWMLEKAKKRGWLVYGVSVSAVCLLSLILGTAAMVDYYGVGVLTVLMFYFLRRRTPLNFLLQGAFLYYVLTGFLGGYYYPLNIFGMEIEFQQQTFCLLSLIPIWLYRGRQGYHEKWFQYFCYGFYPCHLLIVYFLWQALM